MNFKVDVKPEKKNIIKDRLHEAKKDTNQAESDKFDGNNLYFLSQADIPHYKTLLVHVMLPSVAWKYHISIAVCAMKNHLRRFTNLKGMLIKLILIKNTACSTNHLLVFHAKKDHIQPQAQREKLIITTVLSAASLSNKKSNFLSHIAKQDYKNENINSEERHL